ncbi:DUF4149 domain-containing protein [Roseateles sp. BYS180W]|uniref:DUF4149 domain-containing protein n=1 Tax=Roseateles rivi TaxID=3299028 RepID=A0ABW7FZ31_9BURK
MGLWVIRLQRLLSAAWLGSMLSLAALVAPAAFALLPRAQAGDLMRRLFEYDARLSLAAGVLLLLLQRKRQVAQDESSDESRRAAVISWELVCPLLALLCTVAGFYALQPLMEQARAGQGAWTFGQLHAVSSVFYAFKLLAVAVLALRLSGPQALPGSARP